jgi:protein phosphatase
MQPLYDIIGDVHGCYDALRRLCNELGYDDDFRHPDGRTLAFVGDLINRGPDSVGVVRTVIDLVRENRALTVLGNHDEAMLRYLRGDDVETRDGGLYKTIAMFDSLTNTEEFKAEVWWLFENTPLCRSLDNGDLMIVHAGIEDWILDRYRWPDDAAKIGTDDSQIAYFMLHGDAIGKSPEGKTLRRDWAAGYHGRAFVVYGHTPQPEAIIRHNTVNIDTGAYRGGRLTAIRWPEKTLLSVPSLYSNVPR